MSSRIPFHTEASAVDITDLTDWALYFLAMPAEQQERETADIRRTINLIGWAASAAPITAQVDI